MSLKDSPHDPTLSQELERQRARYGELTRLSPVGLFETDTGGRLVYANARLAELLGMDVEALLGQAWTALFVGATPSLHDTALAWAASAAAGVRFGAEFAVDQGGPLPTRIRLESTSLVDPAAAQPGAVLGHLFTLVDVSERLEAAPARERRGRHDALTGLADRERFESRLQDALTLAREEQLRVTLLFIDIDQFSHINELYGHHAGDAVLKTTAQRLRRAVRANDLVARVGGDEFALLLLEPPSNDAIARLQAKIEQTLARPIDLGSSHLRIKASVAVTRVPEDGGNLLTLLQQADAEMVRLKHLNRQHGHEELDRLQVRAAA